MFEHTAWQRLIDWSIDRLIDLYTNRSIDLLIGGLTDWLICFICICFLVNEADLTWSISFPLNICGIVQLIGRIFKESTLSLRQINYQCNGGLLFFIQMEKYDDYRGLLDDLNKSDQFTYQVCNIVITLQVCMILKYVNHQMPHIVMRWLPGVYYWDN